MSRFVMGLLAAIIVLTTQIAAADPASVQRIALPNEVQVSVTGDCLPHFTADSHYVVCGNLLWDTGSGNVIKKVPSLVTGYEMRPQDNPKVRDQSRYERFEYIAPGMSAPGLAPYPKSSSFKYNLYARMSFAYQPETGLFHYFLATELSFDPKRPNTYSMIISVGTVDPKSGKTTETWFKQFDKPKIDTWEARNLHQNYLDTLKFPTFGGDAWYFQDEQKIDHIVSTVRKNEEWKSQPRNAEGKTPPAFPGARGDELIVGIAGGTISYAHYSDITTVDRKTGAVLNRIRIDSTAKNQYVASTIPKGLLVSPDGRYILATTAMQGAPVHQRGLFLIETAEPRPRVLALRDTVNDQKGAAWRDEKVALQAAVDGDICAALTGKWYHIVGRSTVPNDYRFEFEARTTYTLSCDGAGRIGGTVRRSMRYSDRAPIPASVSGTSTAKVTGSESYERGKKYQFVKFSIPGSSINDPRTPKLEFFEAEQGYRIDFAAAAGLVLEYNCPIRVVHTDSHPVLEMACNGGRVVLMKSDQWAAPDF